MVFPYKHQTNAENMVDFPEPFGAFISTVCFWSNGTYRLGIEQNLEELPVGSGLSN